MAESSQRRLASQVVNQVYRQASLGMWATLVNALIIVVVCWREVPAFNLLLWSGLALATTSVRYYYAHRYLRSAPDQVKVETWRNWFVIGLGVTGLVWGSSAWLIFPVHSTAHQVFLAFALGGMVAGAAGTFAVVIWAFRAFTWPALLPLIIRFLLLGDEIHLFMGLMILLGGLLMSFVARRVNATTTTMLSLRLEVTDLIGRLTEAKQKAEDASEVLRAEVRERKKIEEELSRHHNRLADLVRERTTELVKANEELKQEIRERKRAEEQRAGLEARLRQSQKMEAIGTLAGGIAHDFNNILHAILGYTELALDRFDDRPKAVKDLQAVLKAALRARNLVQQILNFSRQTEQERRPMDLGPVVQEALELLRATLPASIEIAAELGEGPVSVLADPTQIHQVVMNLCANAAQAMGEEKGVLKVGLDQVELGREDPDRPVELDPGRYWMLTVSDTGQGMDRQVLDRIFEPFFTTKDQGRGSGMGLAVVHGIVTGHGGGISVASRPGQGSTFIVYLPLPDEEGERAGQTLEKLPGGRERVLMVGRDPVLTDLGRRDLADLGYRITLSTTAPEALGLVGESPDSFDLVLIDKGLPGMDGEDLAERMSALRPDLPVILCAGFSDRISPWGSRSRGISKVLRKPLVRREMARAVREVLDGEAG